MKTNSSIKDAFKRALNDLNWEDDKTEAAEMLTNAFKPDPTVESGIRDTTETNKKCE